MIALLMMANVQAQEGEIIFIDFEPDMTLTQGVNTFDNIELDIDGNGDIDIIFDLRIEEHGIEAPFIICYNNWLVTHANDSDTLSSGNLHWGWFTSPYNDRYCGLRNAVGEDFYYGWIYSYVRIVNNRPTLFIDRMAYCPIPNYPLQVGQTGYH